MSSVAFTTYPPSPACGWGRSVKWPGVRCEHTNSPWVMFRSAPGALRLSAILGGPDENPPTVTTTPNSWTIIDLAKNIADQNKITRYPLRWHTCRSGSDSRVARPCPRVARRRPCPRVASFPGSVLWEPGNEARFPVLIPRRNWEAWMPLCQEIHHVIHPLHFSYYVQLISQLNSKLY